MEEKKLKLEIFEDLIEKNLEVTFANALSQSSAFIDKILIEISEENIDRQSLVKNLINLNLFMQNSIFEYKLKQSLSTSLENKKKELESLKESMNQSDLLVQDQ